MVYGLRANSVHNTHNYFLLQLLDTAYHHPNLAKREEVEYVQHGALVFLRPELYANLDRSLLLNCRIRLVFKCMNEGPGTSSD